MSDSQALLRALGVSGNSARPRKPSSEPARVLLADDEAYHRRLIRVLLASAQVSVTEVSDGQAVIDLIALRPFDAVILDMDMPLMNGPDTLVWIRRNYTPWADIPILGLACEATEQTARRLSLLGLTDWTRKPVDRADLINKLSRMLPAQMDAAG
jgi:CheY-like chemotaxis protein